MRRLLLIVLLSACDCSSSSLPGSDVTSDVPTPEPYTPRISVLSEGSCVTLRDGVACWGSDGNRHEATPPYAGDAIRPMRVAGVGPVADMVVGGAIDGEGRMFRWAGPQAEASEIDGVRARAFIAYVWDYVSTENELVGRSGGVPIGVEDTVFYSSRVALRRDGAVFVVAATGDAERAPFDGVQLSSDGIVLTADGRRMERVEGGWQAMEQPEPMRRMSRTDGDRCAVGESGTIYDGEMSFALDAIDVDCGRTHACAILASGEVVCWGQNIRGQLGDGTQNPSETPVSVMGLDLNAEVQLTMDAPPADCLEPDDDGDGVSSRLETSVWCPSPGFDPDGDGVDAVMDTDSDGDGYSDGEEMPGTACEAREAYDADQAPAFLDKDTDNDGVWDEDEVSLEATRTPDHDGDGCGDLFEYLYGGCEQDILALTSDAVDGRRLATVTWIADVASELVEVATEDVELVHGEPTGGPPYTLGEGVFTDVSPGDELEVRLQVFAEVEHGTAIIRGALVAREGDGEELHRQPFISVIYPDSVCLGP